MSPIAIVLVVLFGLALARLPDRIVGGQDATIEEYPYQTSGKPSEQLQVIHIPIVARHVCESKWANFVYTKRMICAGPADGSKDTCIGDSGGPLVVNGKQCGIVSWGLGCADRNHPGIYSNIATQLDWIKSVAEL